MDENQQAIVDRLHNDDGVWEAVQTALEQKCDELGLDAGKFEWAIVVGDHDEISGEYEPDLDENGNEIPLDD